MRHFLKITAYMVIGFVAPVAICLVIFSSTISSVTTEQSEISPEIAQKFEAIELPVPAVPEQAAEEKFYTVNSDKFLDPQTARPFLIALSFRLDELPPIGARQKLIAKYDSTVSPYPGWGMAIFSYKTSSRPAIYWKGLRGKGRWFLFSDVELAVGKNYQFVLLAMANKQLLGFWKEESSGADTVAKFIGGYDASDVGLPASDAQLYFGVRGSRESSFRGVLQKVVVATLPNEKSSRREFQQMLNGSLEALTNKIAKTDLYLDVDSSGKDLSGYSRQVTNNQNL